MPQRSAQPGLRANFLLGLREDALAKLDAFKGRIPNLFANYLRLDHLDRQGGRAAILGPIERYNELTGETAEVEPELVEAVLDQVAAGEVDVGRAGRGGVQNDEDRIEAPYLQLVLERLWQVERERGSPSSGSQRSGSWEAPSRSCERISSGRSGASSRQSRTSPQPCSTTS